MTTDEKGTTMTPSLNIDTLTLEKGAHKSLEDGACVLEAVAFIAGEPWSDHPECVSPVIAAFLRTWNDDSDDDRRQELKRYIQRLVNSAGTSEQEETRAWLATDWLVRVQTPAWLRLAGLTSQAETLESLQPVDADNYPTILPVLKAVRENATAAQAAVRDAAGVAARDAAQAAAQAAAGVAAQAAVRVAVMVAAQVAAQDALAPTVLELRVSAHDLVDRMLTVTERNQ